RLESDPAALLALCRGFGVGRVLLAHDSVTSFLGAMGYGSGVVVAAGTGVVTLGVGERSVARVDGWGNIIGDAGSGYWIGRAGLEAVMRAYDGRSPATALAEVAQASFSSLSGAYIELQTDPDRVARVASFAKQVAELAGRDAVCASICRDAGRELALSAITAARRAGLSEPRVALVGGVFSAPAVKQSCVEALRERWPGFEPAPPLGDALDGAAALAGLPEDHPLAPRVAIAG
ncbi:MAG: ATPase, partial [Propionibacteriaceae bacterium]|nr:ATPase [Propionibacteriaceae bacterium]